MLSTTGKSPYKITLKKKKDVVSVMPDCRYMQSREKTYSWEDVINEKYVKASFTYTGQFRSNSKTIMMA